MAEPAPALLQLLRQLDAVWPERSHASDGILGDASHQARVSDHNTGDALDITFDVWSSEKALYQSGTVDRFVADLEAKGLVYVGKLPPPRSKKGAAGGSAGQVSQAADEAAVSRIYAGQHFRYDEDAGQALGDAVADDVVDNALLLK